MRPYSSSYASNTQKRSRYSRSNGQRKWNAGTTVESHGPDVKVRGTIAQIAERYLSLARETANTDRVKAENYYQHAEHYLRLARRAETDKGHYRRKFPQTSQRVAVAPPDREVSA
ncbi:MAG: DUF4167 domain-containing protein [Alphaproteobacteria bacterium GM7ARS4]|nr:DUF4167 domain-containing protein [Alphaproteobacteria bacterium GM7ARS4]